MVAQTKFRDFKAKRVQEAFGISLRSAKNPIGIAFGIAKTAYVRTGFAML